MQVTAKKGIKCHGEKSISAMYKYNTQIEYMKVMRELELDSIKKSQKRGALRAINLIK